MAQNIYDNDTFFSGYSRLPRSREGRDGAPAWAGPRAMLPALRALLERHQAWEQLYEVLSFRAQGQAPAQQKATYLELAELAELRLQRLGLAFLDVEIDVGQHMELPEPLVDALELDHRFDLREISRGCGHDVLPDGA